MLVLMVWSRYIIVTRFGIFVKRWCLRHLEYACFRHHRIKILSFYVTVAPINLNKSTPITNSLADRKVYMRSGAGENNRVV